MLLQKLKIHSADIILVGVALAILGGAAGFFDDGILSALLGLASGFGAGVGVGIILVAVYSEAGGCGQAISVVSPVGNNSSSICAEELE